MTELTTANAHPSLNAREKILCKKLAQTENIDTAAAASGYTSAEAVELIESRPQLTRYYDELCREKLSRSDIKGHLAHMIAFDKRQLYDKQGNPRNMSELTYEQALGIDRVTITERARYDPTTRSQEIERITEIRHFSASHRLQAMRLALKEDLLERDTIDTQLEIPSIEQYYASSTD